MSIPASSIRLRALVAGCLAVTLSLAAYSQQSPEDRRAAAEAAAKAAQARIQEAAALPTPKTADGHVDLSGFWTPARAFNPFGNNPAGRVSPPDTDREIHVFPASATVAAVNAGDRANSAARRANTALRPKYKPEFAAKAMEFFDRGDLADPTYGCMLPGVVRLGEPSEIFQRPGAVVLLYEGLVNRFRVIPVDGRKLEQDLEALPLGHPVGRWEGNSLVIESRGFMPDYWLDKDGSYHTGDLRLTERFTRQGNTLRYELVAEDPMFAEPFKPEPKTMILGKPGDHILEEYACEERDIKHMVNETKH